MGITPFVWPCWLLDNYADLEHKQVWQSLVVAICLLVFYEIYTSNAGAP